MGLGVQVGILAELKEANAGGFAYFKGQFGILNQLSPSWAWGCMSNLKNLTRSCSRRSPQGEAGPEASVSPKRSPCFSAVRNASHLELK